MSHLDGAHLDQSDQKLASPQGKLSHLDPHLDQSDVEVSMSHLDGAHLDQLI